MATPGAMKLLSKVARVLGPRGLMPNNKLGTVTDDVRASVHLQRAGGGGGGLRSAGHRWRRR